VHRRSFNSRPADWRRRHRRLCAGVDDSAMIPRPTSHRAAGSSGDRRGCNDRTFPRPIGQQGQFAPRCAGFGLSGAAATAQPLVNLAAFETRLVHNFSSSNERPARPTPAPTRDGRGAPQPLRFDARRRPCSAPPAAIPNGGKRSFVLASLCPSSRQRHRAKP
jgi:hypothetical protein